VKLLKAFGLFWYDFVIGDDWKIAVYVVIAVGAVAGLAVSTHLGGGWIALAGSLLLGGFFALGVSYDARRSPPTERRR
jgi:hypothetical protein